MPLKAVLFDMDGVIVDTEPLHRKAYYKMFDEIGVEVSEELFTTFTGASTKKVCTTLISHFGLETTHQELAGIKRKYFKDYFHNDESFDLIPGVKKLIENFHQNDIKMVLASSASMVTINMVFDKFELHDFFLNKISGADLKESKPHPEIFVTAAKLANEPTNNCLVIEDSTNGIRSAHAAEIFCVAYKSKHSINQDYEKANLVITDFSEIEYPKICRYF